MLIGRIQGYDRYLGAPAGWNHDRDGPCGALPIRDGTLGGMPAMTSSWIPTPDELEQLNAGAAVHLMVCGHVHPPVSVYVTDQIDPIDGRNDD